MNQGEKAVLILERCGYAFWTGVPCTYLKLLFGAFLARPTSFVSALREDSACGIAAGAYLGGAYPVVAMQNSGFAAAANAIASLLVPYRIPALLIVSWRGASRGDSQEHAVLGEGLPLLIKSLGLSFIQMSGENLQDSIEEATARARAQSVPIVITVPQGVL